MKTCDPKLWETLALAFPPTTKSYELYYKKSKELLQDLPTPSSTSTLNLFLNLTFKLLMDCGSLPNAVYC